MRKMVTIIMKTRQSRAPIMLVGFMALLVALAVTLSAPWLGRAAKEPGDALAMPMHRQTVGIALAAPMAVRGNLPVHGAVLLMPKGAASGAPTGIGAAG